MKRVVKYIAINFVLTLILISTVQFQLQGQTLRDSLLKVHNISSAKDTATVVLLNNIAKSLYMNAPDEALKYAYKGVKLSKQIEYEQGLAYCYNTIGLSYWNKSDYDKAREYLQKALKLNKRLNRKDEIAKNYVNLGIIFKSIADYPTALEYYIQSLKIHEQLNTGKATVTHINIANLYMELKDFTQAEIHLKMALKSKSISMNPKSEALAYENYGEMMLLKGEYSAAIPHLNKAIVSSRKHKLTAIEADAVFGKAQAFANLKLFDSAFICYRNAISLNLSLNRETGLCENLYGIGALYLDKAKANANNALLISKSLDTLFLSAEIGKKIKLNHELVDIYSEISEAYALSNIWQAAYKYNKLSTDLRDSIFNSETELRMRIMHSSYESSIQEEKIILLEEKNSFQLRLIIIIVVSIVVIILTACYFIRKQRIIIKELNQKNKEIEEINLQFSEQNRIISESTIELEVLNEDLQQSKDQLAQANAGKDRLFSIISHDLRAPFTGFIGLADLIANEAEKMPIQDLKQIGKSLFDASNNTLKLLNNLLDWARLQTGNLPFEVNEVSALELINAAIYPLKSLYEQKSQKLYLIVSDSMMINCDENMITTVIRNILINAIKFTPINGRIEIAAYATEDGVSIIRIKDSGVGISEANITKLFNIEENITTIGTNNEKGSGLGLILCKEFVEKHNGKIWAESEVAKGTSFYFALPNFKR